MWIDSELYMREHVFPPAPSTPCSSTTRPRCVCTTHLGPRTTWTTATLFLLVFQRQHWHHCRESSLVSLPDYITDLLTPGANIPTRSSLHVSRNGDLFLPRTERQIGDGALSVAASCAWTQLPTELKLMQSSATASERHLKPFCSAPRTNYVM